MAIIDRQQEKTIIARIIDLAESVLKNHQREVTDFYDPYHTGLVFSMVKRMPNLAVLADGGYPDAERSRVVIYPDYLLPEQVEANLAFLSVKGNFKMVAVTHRDYLGSLMGLGLKREKLGDIIVHEAGADLIVDADVASYIRANLTKIGRVKVEIADISRSKLQLPEANIKTTKTTVASLRLDAIAAAGYGTSRSKLVREISAERLSLNWCTCSNPAATVKEGDMLSIRGRGRVKVAEVGGNTKKGRVTVVLHKYI
jgi:photosystem II S4 domain protein